MRCLYFQEGITIDDVPITPCIIAKGKFFATRLHLWHTRIAVLNLHWCFLMSTMHTYNKHYLVICELAQRVKEVKN